jgi:hypothetical protein
MKTKALQCGSNPGQADRMRRANAARKPIMKYEGHCFHGVAALFSSFEWTDSDG